MVGIRRPAHKEADPPESETEGSQASLTEIADFGSNPGALRMLIHLPKDLPSKRRW